MIIGYVIGMFVFVTICGILIKKADLHDFEVQERMIVSVTCAFFWPLGALLLALCFCFKRFSR